MPARPADFDADDQTASRVAANLRSRRLQLQLTQAQVAEKIDISVEAYARLERGLALPSFPTLLRACSTLQTTPDALLTDHDGTLVVGGPRVRHQGEPQPPVARPQLQRQPLALKNPSPPDEPDEPPGLAPDGRVRLGAREQEKFDLTIEVLRRLDRDDRAAVRAVVMQLARRAGILPPLPPDDQPTVVVARPQTGFRRVVKRGRPRTVE